MDDAERLQWYQDQHELHYGLELLYVVDGYRLECVLENDLVAWSVEAPTLSECIDLGAPKAVEFKNRYLAMRASQSGATKEGPGAGSAA